MSNVVNIGIGHSHKMFSILFSLFILSFAYNHSTDLSVVVVTSKNTYRVPLTFPRWVCAHNPSCSVPGAPAHTALSESLNSPHPIPGALPLPTRSRELGSSNFAFGNPDCHVQVSCSSFLSRMLAAKVSIQLRTSSTQARPDLRGPHQNILKKKTYFPFVSIHLKKS